MKKLFPLFSLLLAAAVFGDTPIKDLDVTNTLEIKSGATATFDVGSKLNYVPSTPIPALNIDWSVTQEYSKTLSANSTFTFTNVSDKPIRVALTNTASNYTVTWPVTVNWPGASQPTQTVGAKTDIWTFVRINGSIYGSVVANYSGGVTPTPTPSGTPTPTPTASPTSTPTPTPTPGAFVPTDIAGLKLWLKADALGLSNNDPVASWTDSSGTSNNATQGTSGKRPVFKTAILNGLPIVRFDGTDDILLCANELPNTASVFMVVAVNTTPANSDLLIANSNGASGGILIWARTSSSTNWGGLNTSFVVVNAAEDLSVGVYNDLELTTSGSSMQFYRNGTLKVNNGTQSYGGPGASSSIGGQADDSSFTDCDIAEVIVYDTVLSSGNRMSVEAYLATKYGL